jgi:type II secretory pathway component PulM
MNPLKPDSGQAIDAAPPGKRQLLFALGLSVAASAGWYLGLRPLEQKLHDSHAQLEALTAQLAAFDQLVADEPPIDSVIDDLVVRARRANRAAAVTANPTRLYDAVHELAKASNVKLARVEPAGTRSRAAAFDKNVFKGAESFGYNIEVSGGYENICSFIDACERDLGISKVVSFHISPQTAPTTPGVEPTLTAIVETTHLKIAISGIADDAPERTADGSQEPAR